MATKGSGSWHCIRTAAWVDTYALLVFSLSILLHLLEVVFGFCLSFVDSFELALSFSDKLVFLILLDVCQAFGLLGFTTNLSGKLHLLLILFRARLSEIQEGSLWRALQEVVLLDLRDNLKLVATPNRRRCTLCILVPHLRMQLRSIRCLCIYRRQLQSIHLASLLYLASILWKSRLTVHVLPSGHEARGRANGDLTTILTVSLHVIARRSDLHTPCRLVVEIASSLDLINGKGSLRVLDNGARWDLDRLLDGML